MPVDTWAEVQRGQPLRWGAWLGLRHLDGSRRAKVYAELPAGMLVPAPWAATADEVGRGVPGLTWRMAGSNDDGSTELYARVPEPTAGGLRRLAALVGDPARLLDVVHRLAGDVLPPPSGVSITMAPDGTPLAVTWFSFAKLLWSTDARAAAAVARVAAEVGTSAASLAAYDALASGPDDGRWRHGMVGAGVDRAGVAWVQAGLRPT